MPVGRFITGYHRVPLLWQKIWSLIILTKPRITLLVSLTGMSAMILEGTLLNYPLKFVGVLAGINLAGASASVFNQYWDRDMDALMTRTRIKRPIPAGTISSGAALFFGSTLGILSFLLLDMAGNSLAALMGLLAIAFYVIIYTIWLKRRTSWNIVIGGAAGTFGPLIGWAAGAGEVSAVPVLMALIIFLWTPPHFWALSLCLKEDYAAAGVPMLPNVYGDRITRIHITIYTLFLMPVTVYFGVFAGLGRLFTAGTIILGITLIWKVFLLWKNKDLLSARNLFVYSIIYMTALFALMPLSR